jgi:hypothetical protein
LSSDPAFLFGGPQVILRFPGEYNSQMRSSWTTSERLALYALARALRSRGIEPRHDPSITDRPDAVFIVEGRRAAVECRYITRSEILERFNSRGQRLGVIYEIIVPREPHLWVKEAIEKKNCKVRQYLSAGTAEEAWLLVHNGSTDRFLGPDKDPSGQASDLLRLGGFMVGHDFTRVWFADLTDLQAPATELFGPGLMRPDVDPDAYVKSFLRRGAPVDLYWQGLLPAPQRGADGRASVLVNLNNAIPIGLPFLDQRYKIDYSRHFANPNRNANRKDLAATVWNKLPEY